MKKSELKQLIKEILRMQMLAGVITESQYKEKINERYEFMGEPDVYNYVVEYFNEDRSRGINPDLKKHRDEIIQNIKDDWGDDYVGDAEDIKFLNGEIQILYKYYQKNQKNPDFQKRMKEIERDKERYKNNLLPLKYFGSILDRPDFKYYSDTTKSYSYMDRDGNYRSMSNEERTYTLDSEHFNTQVDKETLDKHWGKNVLKYLGLKR
jgi:hypothetical protein